MIFSENRFPLFGIMLQRIVTTVTATRSSHDSSPGTFFWPQI